MKKYDLPITILVVINRGMRQTRKAGKGKAMIIIEPRRHPRLQQTLENFDSVMDKSWDLYVFYGKGGGDYARKAAASVTGRRVFLEALSVKNLTADEYNELFKQTGFWNKIRAENILVFQTDAALCASSKKKIEDFTRFDYIGCHWGVKVGPLAQWEGHSYYGIGGLSFRKKSFTLRWIRENPGIKPSFAEDVFFANGVHKSPRSRRPQRKDLAEFCSQGRYDADSLGAHKISWMKKRHTRKFLKYCPAAEGI